MRFEHAFGYQMDHAANATARTATTATFQFALLRFPKDQQDQQVMRTAKAQLVQYADQICGLLFAQ
jgi:hypothetical protein